MVIQLSLFDAGVSTSPALCAKHSNTFGAHYSNSVAHYVFVIQDEIYRIQSELWQTSYHMKQIIY